jgi:hypothetical protein
LKDGRLIVFISPSTLAITPQAALLGQLNNNLTTNVWTPQSSYTAAASKVYNLTFQFSTDNNDFWYMDDVSVRHSTSAELLTNGGFESSAVSPGWTSNIVSACSSTAGVSTNYSHSSSYAFYATCNSPGVSISQFFNGTAGQVYNVSFWYYYIYVSGGGSGSNPNEMNIYVN